MGLSNTELAIVEVQKLALKPGDILALRVPEATPSDLLESLYMEVAKLVPDGVKIAVVPDTTQFQIITPS